MRAMAMLWQVAGAVTVMSETDPVPCRLSLEDEG